MDIIMQMCRLPFNIVATTLEPFLRMGREAERATGLSAPALSAPLVPRPAPLPSLPPVAIPAPAALPSFAPPSGGFSRKDDMNDDLIKLVKYRIVYTKPDEEEFLEEGNKLIDYPTNPAELASEVLLGWVKNHLPNPDIDEDLQDPKNWRYLKVRTEVIERYPSEVKYYEKRQTKAQEKIASSLLKSLG
jgi:hypothetical protein